MTLVTSQPCVLSEALDILPQIVPNSPEINFSESFMWIPEKLAPQRKAWREWIQQNRDSLQKQEPKGEGAEASEKICKPVLKKDRAFDWSLFGAYPR